MRGRQKDTMRSEAASSRSVSTRAERATELEPTESVTGGDERRRLAAIARGRRGGRDPRKCRWDKHISRVS